MPDRPQHLPGRFARASARSGVRGRALAAAFGALAAVAMAAPAGATATGGSFLASLHSVTTIGSAVPSNGDLNPYGVVTVPRSVGALIRGDTLVSNFNDAENLQGTGSTIVELAPNGALTVFAHIEPSVLPGSCPGGVGLTTALGILPHGYVIVGSLPTTNGQAGTAKAGCLIVLDSHGAPIETISGPPINGPWDLATVSFGNLSAVFVTDVLNGTVAAGTTPTDGGTVARLVLLTTGAHAPAVLDDRVIATGFPERTDPAALVIGPTGDALSRDGTLYVADTLGNRIAAVPGALLRLSPLGAGGETVSAGGLLNGPLGLALAPDGGILTANAGDGDIVETTPAGSQVAHFDTGAGGGGLFGLTLTPDRHGVLFVNDTENTLDLLQ